MHVTPVYKKGPKSKAENYHPISLTCICCKVLEHIINSNIMSHLDKNKILFQNQHGFRSRVSCETQLIQFTQDLYDTLNQKGQTDVIVMNISKAFDKVDHQRLLLKLHRLSFYTSVITSIQSVMDFSKAFDKVDHQRLLLKLPSTRHLHQCHHMDPIIFIK